MHLKQNTLAIGYVHSGSNKDVFLRSLWNFNSFDIANRKVWSDRVLISATSHHVDNNRNDVTNEFLYNSNKEALLFIDTDMNFEPETVYMLIDALDPITHPVISGFYGAWRKGVLYSEWWDYDEMLGFITTRTFKGGEGELQKIDGCGMGFCLIHRSVFETFPILKNDPWRWFGRDIGMFEGTMRRLDEDVTFCKRLKFDLNPTIPVFGHCSTGLLIEHLKESPISLQTWLDQLKLQAI